MSTTIKPWKELEKTFYRVNVGESSEDIIDNKDINPSYINFTTDGQIIFNNRKYNNMLISYYYYYPKGKSDEWYDMYNYLGDYYLPFDFYYNDLASLLPYSYNIILDNNNNFIGYTMSLPCYIPGKSKPLNEFYVVPFTPENIIGSIMGGYKFMEYLKTTDEQAIQHVSNNDLPNYARTYIDLFTGVGTSFDGEKNNGSTSIGTDAEFRLNMAPIYSYCSSLSYLTIFNILPTIIQNTTLATSLYLYLNKLDSLNVFNISYTEQKITYLNNLKYEDAGVNSIYYQLHHNISYIYNFNTNLSYLSFSNYGLMPYALYGGFKFLEFLSYIDSEDYNGPFKIIDGRNPFSNPLNIDVSYSYCPHCSYDPLIKQDIPLQSLNEYIKSTVQPSTLPDAISDIQKLKSIVTELLTGLKNTGLITVS